MTLLINFRKSETINFWRTVKFRRGFIPRSYEVTIEQWSAFYEAVFPPRKAETPSIEGGYDDILDRRIEVDEVILHIKNSKIGKAPGDDQITNEFYKHLPGNWILYVTAFFNKILENEIVPSSWGNVLMCMIYKKGDKKDPGNYRGIALINTLAKLFTSIMKSRLVAWAIRNQMFPECQAGFVEGRGCLDNNFTLMLAINLQLRLKGRKVFAFFVDLRRAFDSVDHNKLVIHLSKIGVSAKFLRLLLNLYSQSNLRVRQGCEFSVRTEITEGVLQGEILSPILFILFLSDLETFFRQRGARGVSIDALHNILALMYADDLVFLTEDRQQPGLVGRILEEYVALKGLKVNTEKSQLVVCGRGRLPNALKPLQFEGNVLETVKKYTYLGITVSSSEGGLMAAREALQKARIASGTAINILIKGRSDCFESNKRIFESICESTLLYGAPVWALRYIELLEPIQLSYYKRIYSLS